ncbi:hypothetical protein C7M84_021241 [Penaeus vannamei]|uniref:Uncharacterized protein n=1 Tax=Penaeus vannamei TaxID=6689 RepID=A0A423S9V4_PENVA|nr:hypothetical protein C7M84_021241 [Penaeus vannamei]
MHYSNTHSLPCLPSSHSPFFTHSLFLPFSLFPPSSSLTPLSHSSPSLSSPLSSFLPSFPLSLFFTHSLPAFSFPSSLSHSPLIQSLTLFLNSLSSSHSTPPPPSLTLFHSSSILPHVLLFFNIPFSFTLFLNSSISFTLLQFFLLYLTLIHSLRHSLSLSSLLLFLTLSLTHSSLFSLFSHSLTFSPARRRQANSPAHTSLIKIPVWPVIPLLSIPLNRQKRIDKKDILQSAYQSCSFSPPSSLIVRANPQGSPGEAQARRRLSHLASPEPRGAWEPHLRGPAGVAALHEQPRRSGGGGCQEGMLACKIMNMRGTGAYADKKNENGAEQGYRLRETDLRLRISRQRLRNQQKNEEEAMNKGKSEGAVSLRASSEHKLKMNNLTPKVNGETVRRELRTRGGSRDSDKSESSTESGSTQIKRTSSQSHLHLNGLYPKAKNRRSSSDSAQENIDITNKPCSDSSKSISPDKYLKSVSSKGRPHTRSRVVATEPTIKEGKVHGDMSVKEPLENGKLCNSKGIKLRSRRQLTTAMQEVGNTRILRGQHNRSDSQDVKAPDGFDEIEEGGDSDQEPGKDVHMPREDESTRVSGKDMPVRTLPEETTREVASREVNCGDVNSREEQSLPTSQLPQQSSSVQSKVETLEPLSKKARHSKCKQTALKDMGSTTVCQSGGSGATETTNLSPAKDVYEFEEEDDSTSPGSLRVGKLGVGCGRWGRSITSECRSSPQCESPPHPLIGYTPSSPPAAMVTPEKGGRCGVKLRLRMKRSPVLDEVIEVGSHLSDSGVAYEPEYEVLTVEGITNQDYQTDHHHHHHRRHRKKHREHRHRSDSSEGESTDVDGTASPRPTMKRLRLILGNETHTITIPDTRFDHK